MNRIIHKPKGAVILLAIFVVFVFSWRGVKAATQVQSEQDPFKTPVSEPEATVLEPEGIWPYGTALNVILDETRELAILSSGAAVLLVDVHDPAEPVVLSDDIVTKGPVEDLDYDSASQQLYIAAGDGGFEIWDLGDPAIPDQLSLTELYYGGVEIPAMGVAVKGDMAYIAADWGWTHWVNISDPTNPVQTGYFGDNVRPLAIEVTGNYVFAAGNLAGFYPGTLARFTIRPDGSLDFSGNINLGGTSHSIFASDSHIFVGRSGSTLYILDLNLHIETTLPITSNGGFISGGLAYVASGSSGLHILNVSNPEAPVEIGVYDSPGIAEDAAMVGSVVALADGYSGIRLVDVSSPTAPIEQGFYETPGDASDVFVSDGYAYLPEYGEGLVVVDVSYPTEPRTVSTHFTKYPHDVHVQGDYAFLADWIEGLMIIDVSEPANPVEVAIFDEVDNIWDVFVQGDYAYISEVVVNEPFWLHIIDISDPRNPTEVGALLTKDAIWEIFVLGEYAYIANNDHGLRVVNISDPANPVEVGFYRAKSVLDVAVQGDYAYVASSDWDGGLLILDISNPAHPRLRSKYNPNGYFWPFSVGVDGSYAYAGDPVGEEKIAVLDIHKPAHPKELEILYPTGDLSDLYALDSRMYLADGKSGLKIYRNTLSPFSATLGPPSQADAQPGNTVIHTFTLKNLGLTDGYNLRLEDNTWSTTLLTETSIRVIAGTSAVIEVQVDVPMDNGLALTDTFSLVAQSIRSPELTLVTHGTTNMVTIQDSFTVYLPLIYR